MDNSLFTIVDQQMPQFNDKIAKGIITEYMKDIEDYISRVFEASQIDYPEELKFVRIERVDPRTDYQKRIYNKTFNISKSDTYMVQVIFSYNGVELPPYYMNLPYVREAGLITMNGSTFLISPVLIDEGLSIGPDSIFIHVNKDKITFMREHYAMHVNGKRVNGYVHYSDVYNGKPPAGISKKQLRRTSKMRSLIMIYLFTKKGVTGSFKDYLGVDIVLGKDEINTSNYNPEEWTIIDSLGIKPKTLMGGAYHKPSWKIAVRNEDYNLDVMTFALSFYYIIDHFYDRVEEENLDDTTIWKLLLGLIIRPEESNEITALNSAQRNLTSLDSHLDVQICSSLASIGVYVNDIYDLFLVIIKSYTSRVVRTTHDLATMYNKRLTVQRYILKTITEKIFKLGYKLQARKKDKNLKERDIKEIIKNHIGMNDIGLINYKHVEVESASNSTDNIIPRLTSRLVLQRDLTRSSKASGFTPDMVLDISIAEAGNLTSMTGDATGRSRLNMYVNIDDSGTILPNPDLLYITKDAQTKIQH